MNATSHNEHKDFALTERDFSKLSDDDLRRICDESPDIERRLAARNELNSRASEKKHWTRAEKQGAWVILLTVLGLAIALLQVEKVRKYFSVEPIPMASAVPTKSGPPEGGVPDNAKPAPSKPS